MGGIGVNVVCPGLRVGGAEGRDGSRFKSEVVPALAPGPMLCDLELLGGGPGGGGGRGMLRPHPPCATSGDSSIGVLVSVPWPKIPAEAARREAGALIGD